MKIIYWTPKAKSRPEIEKKIREKFHLGTYESVNGETPVYSQLSLEELKLLEKVEMSGYIHIRDK